VSPTERFRASVFHGFRLIADSRTTVEGCEPWHAEHLEAMAAVSAERQAAIVTTEANRWRVKTGRNPWSGERIQKIVDKRGGVG